MVNNPSAMADARRTAHRKRMQVLLTVSRGEATLEDVIRSACEPGQSALLRIRLTQLLMAQPDVGRATAYGLLRRMMHVLGSGQGSEKSIHSLNIAWLVNPHSGGRRWDAWLDAVMTEPDVPVWEGFPWRPSPYAGRNDEQS